jgi:tRNA A37 threonylcarbamoyladenosine biosynthesis protein TsaE
LRLVTKRAHVEDLARQAQKILAPLTDETCVLLDIELNAGRPELLRARE